LRCSVQRCSVGDFVKQADEQFRVCGSAREQMVGARTSSYDIGGKPAVSAKIRLNIVMAVLPSSDPQSSIFKYRLARFWRKRMQMESVMRGDLIIGRLGGVACVNS
jgi:hypothetical protein